MAAITKRAVEIGHMAQPLANADENQLELNWAAAVI